MSAVGVYIHFPYCEKKCPYCDFNSHETKIIPHKEFLEAYKKDFDFYISTLKSLPNIVSIFFGGGTPSLMEPFVAEEIIKYICSKCNKSPADLEITLEANPSSFEVSKFKSFKSAGINRVSIGVQSFIEEDLKKLGRVHDKTQAIDAITEASLIFNNFSFDLIYAREGQTIESWAEELNFTLKTFKPSHISLYSLTIEKGTKFFSLYQNGKLTIPKNQEEFYDVTNQICKHYNLPRYEVSNYAKFESECKHNVLYWTGMQYIGIGPGAHGRIETSQGRVATMNFNSPEKYLKSIYENGNAVQIFEILDKKTIALEIISTGLRTVYGFEKSSFVLEYLNDKNIEILTREGIITEKNNRICPTEKGISLTDGISKFIFNT